MKYSCRRDYTSECNCEARSCRKGKLRALSHLFPFPALVAENAQQPAYLLTLSAELANESRDINIRNAAGIALKNALSARVSYRHVSL